MPSKICEFLKNEMEEENQKIIHFNKNHARKDSDTFWNYLREEKLCDVTIKCTNNQQLKAHRIVLCSRSEYFASLLLNKEPEVSEIVLEKTLDLEDLSPIIEYIYKGVIEISHLNVFKIFEASKIMQVFDVEIICNEFILKIINRKNCFDISKWAKKHDHEEIFEEANKILFESYVMLDLEQLTEFIPIIRDERKSEKYVFTIITKWLNHMPDKRKVHMKELLLLVKLDQLDQRFLLEDVKNAVGKDPECLLIIMSALKHILEGAAIQKEDNKNVNSCNNPKPSTSTSTQQNNAEHGKGKKSRSKNNKFKNAKDEKKDIRGNKDFLVAEKVPADLVLKKVNEIKTATQQFEEAMQAINSQVPVDPAFVQELREVEQEVKQTTKELAVAVDQVIKTKQQMQNIKQSITNVEKEVNNRLPQTDKSVIEKSQTQIKSLGKEVNKVDEEIDKTGHLIDAAIEEMLMKKKTIGEQLNGIEVKKENTITVQQLSDALNEIKIKGIKIENSAPSTSYAVEKEEKEQEKKPEQINRSEVIEELENDDIDQILIVNEIQIYIYQISMDMLVPYKKLDCICVTDRFGAAFVDEKLILLSNNDNLCFEIYKEHKYYELEKLQTERKMASVASVGNHIYVIGGVDVDRILSSIERWHLHTKKWTLIAELNEPRYLHKSVTVNNKIYVIGGSSTLNYLSSVECYDPDKNTWSYCASMNKNRSSFGIITFKGLIYVFGGKSDEGVILDCIERFDPRTNEWKFVGKMVHPLYNIGAALLGTKVLLCGIHINNREKLEDVVEVFDLYINECKALPNFDFTHTNRLHMIPVPKKTALKMKPLPKTWFNK